jgi:hypothetical protein
MNKAQKIILLAAATWIVYQIVFPSWGSFDAIVLFNGKLMNNQIDWGSIRWTVVIAGGAFVIAGRRRPRKKE